MLVVISVLGALPVAREGLRYTAHVVFAQRMKSIESSEARCSPVPTPKFGWKQRLLMELLGQTNHPNRSPEHNCQGEADQLGNMNSASR